jgi:hypothetical protein
VATSAETPVEENTEGANIQVTEEFPVEDLVEVQTVSEGVEETAEEQAVVEEVGEIAQQSVVTSSSETLEESLAEE